eukprot:CAMPEP_0175037784 /NCGR_PEP_ID=MMETSP0005-20121125/24557_1 /TAXON_ID=420556 /ORGANISM="Ochromonas sp., Strain CCMP1393" /LENGTH=367 /DNA_ID=CAMNT_0016299171 /DNA_START=256 /DNA_END=1359 /DNA_ORIENTATION=+
MADKINLPSIDWSEHRTGILLNLIFLNKAHTASTTEAKQKWQDTINQFFEDPVNEPLRPLYSDNYNCLYYDAIKKRFYEKYTAVMNEYKAGTRLGRNKSGESGEPPSYYTHCASIQSEKDDFAEKKAEANLKAESKKQGLSNAETAVMTAENSKAVKTSLGTTNEQEGSNKRLREGSNTNTVVDFIGAINDLTKMPADDNREGEVKKIMKEWIKRKKIMKEWIKRKKIMKEWIKRKKIMKEWIKRKKIMKEWIKRKKIMKEWIKRKEKTINDLIAEAEIGTPSTIEALQQVGIRGILNVFCSRGGNFNGDLFNTRCEKMGIDARSTAVLEEVLEEWKEAATEDERYKNSDATPAVGSEVTPVALPSS